MVLTGGWVVLTLSGCSGPGPKPAPAKDMGGVAPADHWSASNSSGEVANGWVADFRDPKLVLLVLEALQGNPDLQASSARLEQSIAIAKQAGAALYPTIGLNAGGTKTSYLEANPAKNKNQIGTGSDYTQLGAGLTVSWELDVWGKLSSAKQGAKLQAEATASDYAAARQSLAAQVSKSWFLVQEAKMQKDLADEFVKNYAANLKIVQAQYNAGDVSRQDLDTSEADLANSQQSAQAAETALNTSIRSLEVLLGRYPGAEIQATDMGTVPPPIPAGLPSQILERRPDVVAAERQVASAFQYSKSASAARLPQIDLTGGINTMNNSFAALVNPASAATNFGLNLFQPLFDAGLLQSQFEQAKGVQKEAVANYKSTAFNAFKEVEVALDNDISLARQEDSLARAAKGYEGARKIAEIRYKEGEIDLTSLLFVQRQELQAKAALINAHGSRLTNRVDLHLALGGNFEEGTIDLIPAPMADNDSNGQAGGATAKK
ncbi:MAG: TolC family protein [Verrucomicrobiales bacterium]|nr:TolC family protein [Verrucomicrobiales bacterium]